MPQSFAGRSQKRVYRSGLEKDDVLENKEEDTVPSIARCLLLDNFYFVAEKNCDISFLEKVYISRQIPVMIEVEDIVGAGENSFLVYRIVEKSE